MIEYGDADIVVAGGTEATVSPLGMGGFAAMRALVHAQRRSRRRPRAPGTKTAMALCSAKAPVCMVLEEYEHAKARGAKIYAELERLWHER